MKLRISVRIKAKLIRLFRRLFALLFGLLLASIIISIFFHYQKPSPSTNVMECLRQFSEPGDCFERNPIMGRMPKKNAHITGNITCAGRTVLTAHFSTDDLGRRITPQKEYDQYDEFVAFVGCSYTFGYWVNDNETLPSHFAALADADGRRVHVYNYGCNGWCPSNLYVLTKLPYFTEGIKEKNGVLVFVLIGDHINRILNAPFLIHHGLEYPYFRITKEGSLKRISSLTELALFRPKTAFNYINDSDLHIKPIVGVNPDLSENLIKKLFEESYTELKRSFPSIRFVILIYPNEISKMGPFLSSNLSDKGILILNYNSLFNKKGVTEGLSVPVDGHPSSLAYKIIATQLYEDMNRKNLF
jgi:hypothetical protein